MILLDVSSIGGIKAERLLMEANILAKSCILPDEYVSGKTERRGLLLGVNEVTRLGMRANDMIEIAEFMRSVLLDNISPRRVALNVTDFKTRFEGIDFCFERGANAYQYIAIRGR